MPLSPITQKRFRRFRSIHRGWWSLVILTLIIAASLAAELWISNRALYVSHQGKAHFPSYGAIIPGSTFGEPYEYETNYRDLRDSFARSGNGTVILPLIPWSPGESDFREGITHPSPPDWSRRHLLGTDPTGRDVFARMVYGFRNVIIFSIAYTALTFLVGILIGCTMGYFGGKTDLIGLRLIEIWETIPFLYMVMISISLIPAETGTAWRIACLLIIMVLFDFTSKAMQMRAVTLREKSRDYVAAARLIGASTPRMIFSHILPNTISVLVTYLPFSIAAGISSLTVLDFLNFGLPKPTPSWGELLEIGLDHKESWWIVTSAFGALVGVLLLVTFIGEAVREAFDPRRHTVYR
ncbi:MAG: ABC transporter permease subunit [Verrucomicrobiota bacterium]|jgi:microcin C transport system permease protein